ncbi:hypothetical protein E2320_011839, partial [Naja naja]
GGAGPKDEHQILATLPAVFRARNPLWAAVRALADLFPHRGPLLHQDQPDQAALPAVVLQGVLGPLCGLVFLQEDLADLHHVRLGPHLPGLFFPDPRGGLPGSGHRPAADEHLRLRPGRGGRWDRHPAPGARGGGVWEQHPGGGLQTGLRPGRRRPAHFPPSPGLGIPLRLPGSNLRCSHRVHLQVSPEGLSSGQPGRGEELKPSGDSDSLQTLLVLRFGNLLFQTWVILTYT